MVKRASGISLDSPVLYLLIINVFPTNGSPTTRHFIVSFSDIWPGGRNQNKIQLRWLIYSSTPTRLRYIFELFWKPSSQKGKLQKKSITTFIYNNKYVYLCSVNDTRILLLQKFPKGCGKYDQTQWDRDKILSRNIHSHSFRSRWSVIRVRKNQGKIKRFIFQVFQCTNVAELMLP